MKGEFSPCLAVFKLECRSSPAFGLGFRLELTPLALLVLRFSESDWNYTIGSPESSASIWLNPSPLVSSPEIRLPSMVSHRILALSTPIQEGVPSEDKLVFWSLLLERRKQ